MERYVFGAYIENLHPGGTEDDVRMVTLFVGKRAWQRVLTIEDNRWRDRLRSFMRAMDDSLAAWVFGELCYVSGRGFGLYINHDLNVEIIAGYGDNCVKRVVNFKQLPHSTQCQIHKLTKQFIKEERRRNNHGTA